MRSDKAMMHSEKEYQAREDLNTLIEAERIKKDSTRLKAVLARKKQLEKAISG